MNKFSQGDLIEVSDDIDFEDAKTREFIAMTSEDKYLCWFQTHLNASAWKYARKDLKMKEFKQGTLIEVSNYTNFKDSRTREFIAMSSENKYLCWTENKIDASTWKYARRADKLIELKECHATGAKIEYKNIYDSWVPTDKPTWDESLEYRIKDGITPEKFKKFRKEIIAHWEGERIELFNAFIEEWQSVEDIDWNLTYRYRVKSTKTVHEFLYKADLSKEFVLSTKPRTLKYIEENFTDYILTGRSWEVPDEQP